MITSRVRVAVVAAAVFALASSTRAQENSSTGASRGWDPQEVLRAERYVRPPADLERLILAPRVDISFTAPSPDRTWFLRGVGPTRGDILLRGKEHVYIGGLQVDTKAKRARSLTTSNTIGLVLVNPRTGATKTIETPKGASISSRTWSPSGTQVAYIANFDDVSHLFVADVATGKSTQLTKTPLNPTLYTDLDYTADGKSLIVVLAVENRGPAPTHGPNNVEDMVTVRMTESRAVPQPVHASLLLDPHDKAALKYYTLGQLALVDVKSKAVKKIGEPRMIRSVEASHDGQYFTVTQMTEPFSYLVPVNAFGSVRELWDASGKTIARLQTTRLREERGGGGDDNPGGFGGGGPTASDTGKRNIEWNPVGPGLTYVESVFGAAGNAPRGGRQAGGAPARGGPGGGQAGNQRPQATSVKFMSWLPPFGANDTKLIYEGGPQLGATVFSADGKMLFASDSSTVFAVRLADGKRFNLGRGVTLSRGGGGGFGGGGGGGGAGGANANADTTVQGGPILTRSLPGGRQFVVVSADGKSVAISGTRTPGVNWASQAPRPCSTGWTSRPRSALASSRAPRTPSSSL